MQKLTINGVELRKYSSIADFEDFINNTPFNRVFRWEHHLSVTGTSHYAGTSNYEEAVDLLKHGSDDLSKRLEKAFKVKAIDVGTKTVTKSFYDVAGFQASVPRYLQGIPTSMINQKKIIQKAKVITLNKDMGYNSSWTPEEIINESVKALAIVKKLESTGIRVNLNLCLATGVDGQKIGCKIRLKNSSERLNISKMAFMMTHPSMLRRILLRWIEVNPDVTSKLFIGGYGRPMDIRIIQEKSEYTLPARIRNVDDVVRDMQVI